MVQVLNTPLLCGCNLVSKDQSNSEEPQHFVLKSCLLWYGRNGDVAVILIKKLVNRA